MTISIDRKKRREIESQQKKALKKLNKLMRQGNAKLNSNINFDASIHGLPAMSDAVSDYIDAIGAGYDTEQLVDLIASCWNLGHYSTEVSALIWKIMVEPVLMLRGLSQDQHLITILKQISVDRADKYAFDPRTILGFTITPQDEGKYNFYLEVKSSNQDPLQGLEQMASNAVNMIREYAKSIN
ncbi:hypothetical protein D5018_08895 [Parashewanella curva]|uniref:Uncharacterized protein n=1 Tax=Parashewanella curva TaxID=2338552 RepID=A0A3L8PZQ5_9GAMM|nr:hypothetical protein [Parashewanella curva]RLV60023.1 hypothetical protein D5018_08895 [Parashewanella curva]